jgi:hypothetical protein
MRASWRQLCWALILVGGGCTFDEDYGGTAFQCSPPENRCPAGQECVGGRCVVPGAPDAAPADAPPDAAADGSSPDAALGVCELAAMAPDNDGCVAAREILGAGAPGGVTVYGDTRGYVNDIAPTVPVSCSGNPENGPDAIYEIAATSGQTITATVSPEAYDVGVYILDACASGAMCLDGANMIGTGSEVATATVSATKTYFIVVDANAAANPSAGCFALHVTLTP